MHRHPRRKLNRFCANFPIDAALHYSLMASEGVNGSLPGVWSASVEFVASLRASNLTRNVLIAASDMYCCFAKLSVSVQFYRVIRIVWLTLLACFIKALMMRNYRYSTVLPPPFRRPTAPKQKSRAIQFECTQICYISVCFQSGDRSQTNLQDPCRHRLSGFINYSEILLCFSKFL